VIRGVAFQPIGCNVRNATTGAAWTNPVNVWVKGDLNAAAPGTVGGGVVVPDARGYAEYVPSAAETDFRHIAFTFDAVGALGDTVQIETISPAEISALATATGLASVAAGVIVADALTEIRVARAGDVINPNAMAFGIGKLNRLFDRWNADPRARFTGGLTSFTPIPNHQPHTLGPNGADWAVTQRPVSIKGANLILNTSTPAVRIPLRIRDLNWWRQQSVQGIATTMPTDLYFEPNWPNGSVYLWPVPTSTYPIELQLDGLFGVMTETDTFWLPFGYRDAITLTLAEELAPGNGQTVAASTKASAQAARDLIFANNDEAPYISTADSGIPSNGGGGARTSFNYRSRSWGA
jgi:hypothetical protein